MKLLNKTLLILVMAVFFSQIVFATELREGQSFSSQLKFWLQQNDISPFTLVTTANNVIIDVDTWREKGSSEIGESLVMCKYDACIVNLYSMRTLPVQYISCLSFGKSNGCFQYSTSAIKIPKGYAWDLYGNNAEAVGSCLCGDFRDGACYGDYTRQRIRDCPNDCDAEVSSRYDFNCKPKPVTDVITPIISPVVSPIAPPVIPPVVPPGIPPIVVCGNGAEELSETCKTCPEDVHTINCHENGFNSLYWGILLTVIVLLMLSVLFKRNRK